jgi:hypothetical protein
MSEYTTEKKTNSNVMGGKLLRKAERDIVGRICLDLFDGKIQILK